LPRLTGLGGYTTAVGERNTSHDRQAQAGAATIMVGLSVGIEERIALATRLTTSR
jgi:hypothetical protein